MCHALNAAGSLVVKEYFALYFSVLFFGEKHLYRSLIQDAEGMGLTRMTELYQDAYDAYLAG